MYNCDFCEIREGEETSTFLIDMMLYPFIEWQTCKKCEDRCHENEKHFSLPKGEIFSFFRNGYFNVKRSDGTVEK